MTTTFKMTAKQHRICEVIEESADAVYVSWDNERDTSDWKKQTPLFLLKNVSEACEKVKTEGLKMAECDKIALKHHLVELIKNSMKLLDTL